MLIFSFHTWRGVEESIKSKVLKKIAHPVWGKLLLERHVLSSLRLMSGLYEHDKENHAQDKPKSPYAEFLKGFFPSNSGVFMTSGATSVENF